MQQSNEGYSIEDYVDLELRNEADESQLICLNNNKRHWRLELIKIKRKAETQMTSHKARTFSLHCDFKNGKIDNLKYMNLLEEEKIWKTKASRFIQQIENRLIQLKIND